MGHYVPENVITNDDLSQLMDTNDQWIQERTGIRQRRWAVKGDGDTTFSMGLKAAKNAIRNSGIDKQDIDFIVFATLSPDYYFPGPGVQVQEALEIDTVGALDVRNQCSGFVYGISVADQFIKTGMYKNILVIGSELQSCGIDVSTIDLSSIVPADLQDHWVVNWYEAPPTHSVVCKNRTWNQEVYRQLVHLL